MKYLLIEPLIVICITVVVTCCPVFTFVISTVDLINIMLNVLYYDLLLGLTSPGYMIIFRISSFQRNHHFLKMFLKVEEAGE